MDDLTQYLRRSWSILIIKDDLSKATLKLAFDADFKIWITSTDVKVFMLFFFASCSILHIAG